MTLDERKCITPATSRSGDGVSCALTLREACARVTRRLDWYGLAHLNLEEVAKTGDGMLAVLIRDERDQSIVACVIDPEVGTVRLRLS